MKQSLPAHVNAGRVRSGAWASDDSYGTTGAFLLQGPSGRKLKVVASDGEGWEHVSVSTDKHPPNWQEMCFIKDLWWDGEETVVQFHPRKSEYVNCHPNCLHLWKPSGREIPLPPSILVGPK